MKRLIAMLVAFMAITVSALAFVPTLPEDFEELEVGYSSVYASYASGVIKVDGDNAFTPITATSSTSYNALGMDGKVTNQLTTSKVGDTDGVSRQVVGQTGLVYSAVLPYNYDPEHWSPTVTAVGGFKTSQFALFSGNLDCEQKSYSVTFKDIKDGYYDLTDNYAEVGNTNTYLREEKDYVWSCDNTVTISTIEPNNLYEVFATEMISGEARQVADVKMDQHARHTYMDGYAEVAGGFMDAYIEAGSKPVNIDFSSVDAAYAFYVY